MIFSSSGCFSALSLGSVLPYIAEVRDQSFWGCPLLFLKKRLVCLQFQVLSLVAMILQCGHNKLCKGVRIITDYVLSSTFKIELQEMISSVVIHP